MFLNSKSFSAFSVFLCGLSAVVATGDALAQVSSASTFSLNANQPLLLHCQAKSGESLMVAHLIQSGGRVDRTQASGILNQGNSLESSSGRAFESFDDSDGTTAKLRALGKFTHSAPEGSFLSDLTLYKSVKMVGCTRTTACKWESVYTAVLASKISPEIEFKCSQLGLDNSQNQDF